MSGLLDNMQATPRKRLLGLLADGLQGAHDFVSKPFGYPNPPAEMLSNLVGVPAVARTLDRVSYGEPLTTGSGWTTKMRPDTVDAAMAVAPIAAKFPRATAGAAMGLLGAADTGAGRAIFIGAKAKTWNAAKAAKAKAMEAAGKDARTIWQETGTFKGADGHWRQEIDDSVAKFINPYPKPEPEQVRAVLDAQDVIRNLDDAKAEARALPGFNISDFYKSRPGDYEKWLNARKTVADYNQKFNFDYQGAKTGSASDFIAHPGLFDSYPALNDIKTTYNPGHSGGQLSENMGGMLIGGGNEKSIGLHELQHAVQQNEGFALGGDMHSMPLILEDVAAKADKRAIQWFDVASRNDPLNPGDIVKPGLWNKAVKKEQEATRARQWLERINSFGDGYALDAYKNLAGEAEARAAQARMNMTAQERLSKFPFDSYDVPVDSLIVRGVK